MNSDWKNEELRSACVQYALQRVGPAPSASALAEVARALGMTGEDGEAGAEDLGRWMELRVYRPLLDGDVRGAGEGSSAAWAGTGEERLEEGECVDVVAPEGALPTVTPDPLSALLAAECDVLGDGEKEDLAAVLEGEGELRLSRLQRTALAVALRGSGMGTRREILLGLLQVLSGGGMEEVSAPAWRQRDTSVVMEAGGCWRTVQMPRIPGLGGKYRSGMREQALEVMSREGVLQRVLLYARVRREAPAPWGGESRVIYVMQLVPAQVFDRAFVSRNGALLHSLVTTEGATLTDWARLFGQTRAAVSRAAKVLNERINEATEGRGSFRAQRAKPDPRKGLRRGAV